MKLSDFQSEYHWMNGLQEYFAWTNRAEEYETVYKAMYHDNWYRKRDILRQLYEMKTSNLNHYNHWLNTLLHEQLDIDLKPQLVVTLIRKVMREDEFIVNLVKFIDYFSENGEAADCPDLGDFLSRGQVKSKIWMIDELKKLVDGSLGNVVFYGGWYNFLAHFIFHSMEVSQITSLDIDEGTVGPSKRLYSKYLEDKRFQAKAVDVNSITWQGNDMYANTLEQANLKVADKVNMVINTSCEHMSNEWFENLPQGKFVVLQTNDYFENPQHSNCCRTMADVKSKYPMSEIYYEGELDTGNYNRFMLIGIK